VVDGEITGDAFVAVNTFVIHGRVGDSTRFFGNSLTISGTVDGDVLAFGGLVDLKPGARITGSLIAFTQTVNVEGVVEGDMNATAGEMLISGTVGGNAQLKADRIQLEPSGSIAGDLAYTSRKEIDADLASIVAGDVHYEEELEDDDGGGSAFFSLFSIAIWTWATVAAMIVGLVALALLRGAAPGITERIDRDALVGTLIGFGTFLIVPAAAVVAIALLVTLPLGVIVLMLFIGALYLAKMPVALWAGRRLLGVLGSRDPSPFLALLLGLLLLYLLFAVPYLGKLVWLVTTWLGLGAMILAARSYLLERRA
jgi:cytoskeletal protein CcmA (bactofilin family)